MKLLRGMLPLCFLLPGFAGAQNASDVEIRFYPQNKLWTYQLEAARGLNSAVLQNTAVVNKGNTSRVVGQVRFELMRGGDVVLAKTLFAADLDKTAKGGNAMAGA
ncbi:MAG: hypothetical protein ABI644_09865 [Arenimonas sp.]